MGLPRHLTKTLTKESKFSSLYAPYPQTIQPEQYYEEVVSVHPPTHTLISIKTIVISLLILSGCAAVAADRSVQIKLDEAIIAKSVTKKDNAVIAAEPANTFTSDDQQAIMLVKLKDVSGKRALRWEWYDPSGNLYYKTEDYKINADGRVRQSSTSWHTLGIKDEKAAALPGKWQVKVFLDGAPVASKEFELKRLADIFDIEKKKSVKPDKHRWALIVGIEKYRNTIPVEFAVSDAEAFRDHANKLLGVPKENTITRINESATKAELQYLLKDRLSGLLRDTDTLYVYYAGHGIPADETPYLLPYDGNSESPAITAYPLEELYGDLNKLPVKNVFVFLDTCFSGKSGRGLEERTLLAGARPGILRVKDPLLLSDKIVVMSAAKSTQISNYYPDKKHGLFTYYLLKGLMGAADKDNDKRVRLTELADYVNEEVQVQTRRLFGLSRSQTPQIAPSPLGRAGESVIAVLE